MFTSPQNIFVPKVRGHAGVSGGSVVDHLVETPSVRRLGGAISLLIDCFRRYPETLPPNRGAGDFLTMTGTPTRRERLSIRIPGSKLKSTAKRLEW